MNDVLQQLPPAQYDSLASQAATSLSEGDLRKAEALCCEVLAADPTHPLACFLQGTILDRRGQKQEAMLLLHKALERDANHPGIHHYLATILKSLGEYRLAEQCLLRAISLDPRNPEVFVNLGTTYLVLAKYDQARDAFTSCLRLRPQDAAGLEGLANVHMREGNLKAAEHFFRSSLSANPQRTSVLNNLANLVAQKGKIDEAERFYLQAIVLEPGYTDAHFNLGNLYARSDCPEKAIGHYEIVVSLRPDFAAGWDTLGNALSDAGRTEEALARWERALALEPCWAQVRWNRAIALLKLGHLREGWQEYEARHEMPTLCPTRSFRSQAWRGEFFPGQTLLVTTEQGLGDMIQMIRYFPWVKARGGSLFVECKAPLTRLLQTCKEIDRVITHGDTLPEHDWHIPVMSLPRVFDTTLESIPSPVPYLGKSLSADVAQRQKPLQIGLAWAGNPTHMYDRRRSCPFASLLKLFEVEGVEWVSLQKSVPEHDVNGVRACSRLRYEHFDDFLATATLIKRLDLVISVDTAVAHLTGALGIPIWILLASAPDWRWLENRVDSPWYPTVRLFRQRCLGDWTDVVEQVRTELDRLQRSR